MVSVQQKRKFVLYLSQAAQPSQQKLEVSWGWTASAQILFPIFATIAEPLKVISRQGVPFVWGSEQEAL